MKKLIGTVAAAALLASAAFAEISFGAGYLNSRYFIGSDESGNVVSTFGQQWGLGGPRFSAFNISGDSEHAGFMGEIQHNGYDWAIGQSFTYIKPIEQIQLIFGFTDQNYLRSDNNLMQFDYTRPGAFGIDEGITFDEFEVSGVGLVIKPIESLMVFAAFDVPFNGSLGKLNEQIGRTGKLGVGYTIGDIGTVKAGVWAKGKGYNKDGEEKDGVNVEAAFDLTAVDGLFVTVGAKIPLGGAAYTSDLNRNPVQVNAGIGLSFIENLSIKLNFASKLNAPNYDDAKVDGNFGFATDLGVDYTFGENWTVFGAVGYANNVYMQSENNYKDCLSFGVGIQKAWSNGTLGIEFVGATNYHTVLDNTRDDNSTGFGWMIPIKMQVSF
ncbi:MAG: hypothetical protein J1E59_09755 [Treponema sp.]|nr:hypothetical protein [Treponema sp.]